MSRVEGRGEGAAGRARSAASPCGGLQVVEVDQAVLAIADAPQDIVALLSDLCREAGIALRLLPTRAELVGEVTLKDVRDLRIDDLLGRSAETGPADGLSLYGRGGRRDNGAPRPRVAQSL